MHAHIHATLQPSVRQGLAEVSQATSHRGRLPGQDCLPPPCRLCSGPCQPAHLCTGHIRGGQAGCAAGDEGCQQGRGRPLGGALLLHAPALSGSPATAGQLRPEPGRAEAGPRTWGPARTATLLRLQILQEATGRAAAWQGTAPRLPVNKFMAAMLVRLGAQPRCWPHRRMRRLLCRRRRPAGPPWPACWRCRPPGSFVKPWRQDATISQVPSCSKAWRSRDRASALHKPDGPVMALAEGSVRLLAHGPGADRSSSRSLAAPLYHADWADASTARQHKVLLEVVYTACLQLPPGRAGL